MNRGYNWILLFTRVPVCHRIALDKIEQKNKYFIGNVENTLHTFYDSCKLAIGTRNVYCVIGLYSRKRNNFSPPLFQE